ncbi:MAG: leucine-rich repeat domain-containing protein [Muribaculaceae bacterium]|nr:leucine-rich repeat domain-containing protein [Muribaculaceae bacterium]
MSAVLNRRFALMRGASIYWETIAKGMIDFTTEFSVPEEAFGTRTNIAERTFWGRANMKEVEIPPTITSIGGSAFSGSGLVNVVLPSSITSLGSELFRGCNSLETCVFECAITSLPNFCFYSCTKLKNLDLPSSITSIGASSIRSNNVLQYVIVRSTTPPTLGANCFDFTNNCPIYVPDDSVATYKTSWSSLASRIFPLSSKT